MQKQTNYRIMTGILLPIGQFMMIIRGQIIRHSTLQI